MRLLLFWVMRVLDRTGGVPTFIFSVGNVGAAVPRRCASTM